MNTAPSLAIAADYFAAGLDTLTRIFADYAAFYG